MSRYGIVYMGSKEKILDLIQYVFDREYNKSYMIDLFTGGFSVSSYALQKTKFNVVSNDLNKYVIALYEEIFNSSDSLELFKYDWISRERFEEVRDNKDNFPDWYVGYVLNVWSFGCNQKDYLYAKDLEQDKHAIHQAIVFDDFRLLESNPLFDGLLIPYNIREIDYFKHPTKRVAFMRYIKAHIKQNPSNVQLQRLEQMENLSQMEHLNAIKRNIPYKKRLDLYSMDWLELYDELEREKPEWLRQGFIYCDPPYEDTKQYLMGRDFNHEEFWNWFRECPYPVYVSSYKAPDDIKPLNFVNKRVLLDNGSKSNDRKVTKKNAVENIYWNGKGNPEPTFLDQLFNNE